MDQGWNEKPICQYITEGAGCIFVNGSKIALTILNFALAMLLSVYKTW
jgi:hypothetical protein